MLLQPYLVFDGRCAEAFRFYERVFEGTIEALMTHGDSPIAAEVPPAWRDSVLHARLVVGDAVLMGSDSPPEHYRPPSGTYVSIGVTDIAQAVRIYEALAEGGTVTMPLGETFWAARFAMLTDRYGIPWMINCAKPQAGAVPASEQRSTPSLAG